MGIGIKNYDKKILFDLIESIMPASSVKWAEVASRYQKASKEEIERPGAGL